MNRQIASKEVQRTKNYQSANICPMGTPTMFAGVSSHRRNYNVALTIGLLGRLDSHPTFKAAPSVARSRAQFQQVHGTIDNPLTHVAPCSLILNGMPLITMFDSTDAKTQIRLIFGGGVMAPPNWRELGTYQHSPSVQNKVDFSAEGHRRDDGLVGAFEFSCQLAVNGGKWLGNGTQQHNASSLADYIEHHYQKEWRPRALAAYANAQSAMAAKDQSSLGDHKQSLLATQISQLQKGDLNFGEIAGIATAKTSNEVWSE